MNETTTPNIVAQPNGRSGFSLAPTSLAEAMEFAGHLARSSLVPKDFQGNPGNIIVAVQWGAEIGLAPLQAMQSIAVVNGRPSIWGDAMIALVKGSGLLESINEEIGDSEASCTVKRRGEAATTRTFSLEDAKRAGLAGKQGPWMQYPKRMLQMRARAWALRDVFPDVLRGVNIAEEARDMPAEAPRDMGPAVEVPKAPESRADRARAAIKKAKPEAPVAIEENRSPALLSALRAIAGARTMDELKATNDAAANLTPFELAAAKEAYKQRRQAIAAETPVDAETGEVFPPLPVEEGAE